MEYCEGIIIINEINLQKLYNSFIEKDLAHHIKIMRENK